MKNQLLAAIALCCATSSTMPLWAQQYGRPDIVVVTPNLTEDEKGGGKYYLYHVATGKFLGANDTRLAVDSLGLEVTLTYGEERAGLYGQEPTVPGEGWIFNMLEGKANGNRFHEVYMTNESEAWIDCGSEGHMLYAITKNADNDYYRIKVVAQDPTYGAESGSTMYANGFWGVADMTTFNVNPLTDPNAVGFEDAGVDWQFVTPEEWEVYQAKNGPLRTALNLAAEQGYTDVAKYEALFNGTDATAEVITSAASELTVAVNNMAGEGATEANPKDFTSYITNPNFDGGNTGWTDTETSVGLGHQTGTSYSDPDDEAIVMSGFCEKWHAAPYSTPANIHQVLTGMPQGRYRLSALTLGYNQADWQETPCGVYLFANDSRAEAWTIKHGGLKNGAVDPKDPAAPSPRAVTLDFYNRGGDITLGLMTENTNCNWIGIDNVQLVFLGNEGGMAGELARVAAEAEQAKADLDAAQSAYTAECGTKLTEAIAHAKELAAVSGASDDDLYAALVQVNTRMDSLNLEIEAYEQFNVTLNEIIAIASNSPYQGVSFPKFMAFYTSVQSGYRNKTLTMADMDGAYDEALRLYNEDVQSLLSDGSISNMTGLLTNPDFTGNSTSGWTKTGDGNYGAANNVVEVWNGRNWEVSQEMSGLPEGFYKISVQAFYAPYSNAGNTSVINNWTSVYGTEGDQVNTVKASLFANDASALICHVADSAKTAALSAGSWLQITEAPNAPDLAGKYIPGDRAAVEAVFNADAANYRDSVTCYVGEDGILKLGLGLSGVTENDSWVAFDNFQLTLVKDEAEQQQGAVAALNAKIAEAQALPTADCMVEEAVNGLLTAITNAQAVVQQATITTEQFVETMASLESAIELFNTANTKFEEINELVNGYLSKEDEIYNEYQGGEDFIDAVYEVDDKIGAAETGSVRYAYATLEEIEQDMNSLQVAYGNLMAAEIDFTTATVDEPVDVTSMIKNPSFQEETVDESGDVTEVAFNYDGWEVSYDKAEVITASDSVFEYYNSENADIHQTIYALKQGYYRVTLNGFYRDGSNEAAALAHRDGTEVIRAYVYAATASGQLSKPLASQPAGVHDVLFHNNDAAVNDTLFNDDLLYHRICNDRLSAKASFNNGYYEVAMSFYVKEGESVDLGVRKDGGVSMDWMLIDDFHLYYLGDGDANKPDDMGTTSVEDAVAEGTAEVVASQWFTINGVRVDEPKQRGIYIRQDILADGSKKAVKVMVR